MKKFYSLIIMLILVLLLGACTTGSTFDASKAKQYYERAMEEYANADSIQIVLTMKSEGETLSTELAYNKNASEYLLKQSDAEGTITTIIKDNKTYMDILGEKSVVDVTATEMAQLMEEYSFDALTSYVKLILSPSFFANAIVESSADSSATLSCDVFSLEVDSELSAEEQAKQEEIIFSLQLKSSLKLEMEYANSKATKLVVLIEDSKGAVAEVILEFKSVETQNIVVENPSDYE